MAFMKFPPFPISTTWLGVYASPVPTEIGIIVEGADIENVFEEVVLYLSPLCPEVPDVPDVPPVPDVPAVPLVPLTT